MGVQVAFVDTNGDIVTVMSPGTDDMYLNGQVYGDYVAWHLDVNISASEFLSSKYFDFDSNDFATRAIKPSPYHDWNKITKLWEFNFIRAMRKIRTERTQLLTACDWTQFNDVDLTQEQKIAWQAYRQELRILPNTIPDTLQDINEVLWPTPPGSI